MGLYDTEIKKKLFDVEIIGLSNTKIMLNNIINAYTEMKSKLIVEIPLQDLLRMLHDIKYADTMEKQIELFEKLLCDLEEHQYNKNRILKLLNIIMANAIRIIQVSCNIEKKEILNKVWKLYKEKNNFYGDIWYNRKESGLCLDMGRKIVRIQGFVDNFLGESTTESMFDTLLDLVNYCNLMYVYLTCIKKGEE